MKPLRVLPCQFSRRLEAKPYSDSPNIPRADGEGRSFDMLVRVEKDGGVSEVLLYLATKVGPCLRETMLKDTF